MHARALNSFLSRGLTSPFQALQLETFSGPARAKSSIPTLLWACRRAERPAVDPFSRPLQPPPALFDRNRGRRRQRHPAKRMWKKTITKCREQETICEISVRSATYLPRRGSSKRNYCLRLLLWPLRSGVEQMSPCTRLCQYGFS